MKIIYPDIYDSIFRIIRGIVFFPLLFLLSLIFLIQITLENTSLYNFINDFKEKIIPIWGE